MSFTKNMDENIGKKISKNVSGKYSQKLIDHAKQFAADALKTASKSAIQKISVASGNLTVNKIANRIIKVSKTSQHNNSETSK